MFPLPGKVRERKYIDYLQDCVHNGNHLLSFMLLDIFLFIHMSVYSLQSLNHQSNIKKKREKERETLFHNAKNILR